MAGTPAGLTVAALPPREGCLLEAALHPPEGLCMGGLGRSLRLVLDELSADLLLLGGPVLDVAAGEEEPFAASPAVLAYRGGAMLNFAITEFSEVRRAGLPS